MSELYFAVDKEKCVKCGICEKNCMLGVVEMGVDGYPQVKKENENRCMKCQHCFASCPSGAISIFGKDAKESIPQKEYVKSDDMLSLIKTRRSCRYYKYENISQENMDKIKEMLAYPPTGCNYRGLSFSIVEDVQVMDEIREYTNKELKKMFKFFPALGMLNRFKKYIMQGIDVIYQNAPHMIVVTVDKKSPCAEQDPVIALSYFELYAKTLGLGTLWCGFATAMLKMFPKLRKRLDIPKNHKIAYVVLFGNPSMNYARSIQPPSAKISSIKK